ncbi:hypothetical protein NDU88_003028 [Pleurodeles waltl]|uniref:Uncharacterized protein n=1 Tax=Pleurodeles waltl TaxID=8319 RepID=A0AAV7NJL0_PLEWA|nr:hypothetical protein NDU88_003028 [Pleurodeles waltl]
MLHALRCNFPMYVGERLYMDQSPPEILIERLNGRKKGRSSFPILQDAVYLVDVVISDVYSRCFVVMEALQSDPAN